MDYKEKQKHFKMLNKSRVRIVWMSKEPGDLKGRTYIKKDKDKDKKENKNNEQG